jgi:hypothetical protein
MMRFVAIIQGFYFLVTGLWPLVSIGTFQMVTGRKTDLWLVKTVGVLVAVIGLAVLVGGLRGRLTPELILLAAGSAVGLAGVDVIYVARRTIAPIYLLDALVELLLVGGWAAGVTAAWLAR